MADDLGSTRAEARAYDDDLNRREVAPTGDDYNKLFSIVMHDAAPALDAFAALQRIAAYPLTGEPVEGTNNTMDWGDGDAAMVLQDLIQIARGALPKEGRADTPCPHCKGLGAFPDTGFDCAECLGGGVMIAKAEGHAS